MESTEKCEAVISQFNGKFIKTPAGVTGKDILTHKCMYCKMQRDFKNAPERNQLCLFYFILVMMALVWALLMGGVAAVR